MKPNLPPFFGLCLLLSASLGGVAPILAQTSAPNTTQAPAAAADELEQLVAPIALYPDVLIALLLPAASESSDVVLAARFLERGGSSAQIDTQPWDESVKGLARYPDVVKWMDENLAWTRQLGDAYLESPDKVMAAIQRVRARARANGLLVDTAEHQVVVEGDQIQIVPAQPNVIYVPRYDPQIIYVERPVYYRPDPWITFGVGFGVGWWLGYDCDWRRRVIVVNPHYRHHWRHHHHDWRHHRFSHRHNHPHHWKPWTPSHRHRHRHHRPDFHRPGREIARPTPLPGAPHRDWQHRRGHGDHRRHDGRRFDRDEHRERRGPAPANAARLTPSQNGRPGNPHVSVPPATRRPDAPRHFRPRDGDDRRDRDDQRPRFARPPAQSPHVVAAPPAPARTAPRVATPQVGGARRFTYENRPAPAQVADASARPAPAPRQSERFGSDASARAAPRMATPPPVEHRGGGPGHRGDGQQRGGRGFGNRETER